MPTSVEVLPPRSTRSTPRRSVTSSVALVAIALIGVALAVWFVLGAVFALVHLLELIGVALAAGWVGYHVGHFRGRRQQDR